MFTFFLKIGIARTYYMYLCNFSMSTLLVKLHLSTQQWILSLLLYYNNLSLW